MIKRIFTIILIIIAIGLRGCWIKGGDRSVKVPVITVYSETIQKTADGTTVASKSGVSAEVLQTINDSLRELFTDASAKNYQNNLVAGAVIIYALHDCGISPESQTPGIKVRADNYDGSLYDLYNPKGKGVKDGIGQIWAAEYYIYNGDGTMSQEYAICTQANGQNVSLALIRNTSRFGKEHRILHDNDFAEYLRTLTHTDESNSHNIIAYTTRGNLQNAVKFPSAIDAGGMAKGRLVKIEN